MVDTKSELPICGVTGRLVWRLEYSGIPNMFQARVSRESIRPPLSFGDLSLCYVSSSGRVSKSTVASPALRLRRSEESFGTLQILFAMLCPIAVPALSHSNDTVTSANQTPVAQATQPIQAFETSSPSSKLRQGSLTTDTVARTAISWPRRPH